MAPSLPSLGGSIYRSSDVTPICPALSSHPAQPSPVRWEGVFAFRCLSSSCLSGFAFWDLPLVDRILPSLSPATQLCRVVGVRTNLSPFILQRGVEAGPWTSVVAGTVIHPRVPRVGSDQGRARREQVATLSITCFWRRRWSSTSCTGDQLAGEVGDQYRGSIARGVCWQGYREHGPLME